MSEQSPASQPTNPQESEEHNDLPHAPLVPPDLYLSRNANEFIGSTPPTNGVVNGYENIQERDKPLWRKSEEEAAKQEERRAQAQHDIGVSAVRFSFHGLTARLRGNSGKKTPDAYDVLEKKRSEAVQVLDGLLANYPKTEKGKRVPGIDYDKAAQDERVQIAAYNAARNHAKARYGEISDILRRSLPGEISKIYGIQLSRELTEQAVTAFLSQPNLDQTEAYLKTLIGQRISDLTEPERRAASTNRRQDAAADRARQAANAQAQAAAERERFMQAQAAQARAAQERHAETQRMNQDLLLAQQKVWREQARTNQAISEQNQLLRELLNQNRQTSNNPTNTSGQHGQNSDPATSRTPNDENSEPAGTIEGTWREDDGQGTTSTQPNSTEPRALIALPAPATESVNTGSLPESNEDDNTPRRAPVTQPLALRTQRIKDPNIPPRPSEQ